MASDEVPLQKKLSELRVIDLRSELDRRGLEKGGIKAALTERLKKALEAEGKNPDEFLFDVADGSPTKKPKGHCEEKEVEEEEEEMMAIDEVGGDDDTKVLDEVGETDSDAIIINMEDDDLLNEESNVKTEDMNGSLEPDKEGSVDGVVKEDKEENSRAKDVIKASIGGGSDSRAPTPPAPTSVPVSRPFTAEDTVNLGSSAERKDDDLSLIVHVDDTLDNDTLDNDILGTPMRNATNDADLKIEAEAMEEVNDDKPDVAPGDKPAEGVAGLLDAEDKENSAVPATSSTQTPGVGTGDEQKEGDGETAKSEPKKDGSEKAKSSASKDTKSGSKDAKGKSTSGRNLWVSGLSSTTKATDLKALFSKHGKVEGAKVVTNAKNPGSRCYGLVTMGSADEASKCIQYLHRTELSGRMISVERAKNDPSGQVSAKQATKKASSVSATSTQKKEKESRSSSHSHHHDHEKDKKEGERKSKERRHSVSSRRHSGHRSDRKDDKRDHKKEDKKEGDKKDSKKEKDTKKEKDILSFDKIKEERERERLRQRERRLREEERRKIVALNRERRIQLEEARKLKDEAIRLEREKSRLRMERERLEREKLEAERMERERMRLERERRERERLEREREEQRRIDQARMQERSGVKRAYDSRGIRDDAYYDSKRPSMGDRYGIGGFDDSRGSGAYERRVEKYDRRDGRGLDAGSRRDGPSSRYPERREGAAPARREPLRRETASGREERRYEDRSREEPRGFGGRYEDRPLAHDSRSRHAAAPVNGREARSVSDRRPARSNSQTWKSGHDRRESRTYASGGGRDEWSDDRGKSGGVSTNWPSNNDRGGGSARWAGGSGSAGSGMMNNSSNQFLESAANIMMGVGVSSSSRGGPGGSDRYSSYKNSLSGSGRRY